MKIGWFLIRLGLDALALLLIAWILSGVHITWWAAILAALVIGILNAVLGTVLRILTFPINLLTLGLFNLVINAVLFWLTSLIVPGFNVSGFWSIVIGSILYSIFSTIIAHFVRDREKASEQPRTA